jgi:hypothetical protein
MTDNQPRPGHSSPFSAPDRYAPWTGPTPPGYPTAPGSAFPPPAVGLPTPHLPHGQRPRTLRKVLIVVAAVLFGIPGAFVVLGLVALAVGGGPSPTAPTPAAPPLVASSPAPAAAPTPPPQPDPINPYDLAAGDCYNAGSLPTDGSTVRILSVEPVPCTAPHTEQVVARFTYTDDVWSEATNATSEGDCRRSFEKMVPRKVLTDSQYHFGRIHSERAKFGQKSVFAACVVATDAPKTDSVLKG